MADLLGEIDTNIASAPAYNRKAIKSDTRRKVRVLSPPPTQKRETKVKHVLPAASTPPQTGFNDDDAPLVLDEQSPQLGSRASSPPHLVP